MPGGKDDSFGIGMTGWKDGWVDDWMEKGWMVEGRGQLARHSRRRRREDRRQMAVDRIQRAERRGYSVRNKLIRDIEDRIKLINGNKFSGPD